MMLVTGRGGVDGNIQLLGHTGRARAVASSDDWRKAFMLFLRERGG